MKRLCADLTLQFAGRPLGGARREDVEAAFLQQLDLSQDQQVVRPRQLSQQR
jgi:hypothetical protein